MAPSIPLCLLLLLLTLTLQSLKTTSAAAATDPSTTHIRERCSRTLHSDLCVKSLLSDPNSLKADDHGLAGIALRLAANNAAETQAYISAILLDTGSNDPGLQQCLNDCSENFVDAIEQLDSSTAALDEKAYDDVSTWVWAAMSDASSCNEGCKQVAKGPNAEAFAKKNEDFFKLCNIALVLTKLLSK